MHNHMATSAVIEQFKYMTKNRKTNQFTVKQHTQNYKVDRITKPYKGIAAHPPSQVTATEFLSLECQTELSF